MSVGWILFAFACANFHLWPWGGLEHLVETLDKLSTEVVRNENLSSSHEIMDLPSIKWPTFWLHVIFAITTSIQWVGEHGIFSKCRARIATPTVAITAFKKVWPLHRITPSYHVMCVCVCVWHFRNVISQHSMCMLPRGGWYAACDSAYE